MDPTIRTRFLFSFIFIFLVLAILFLAVMYAGMFFVSATRATKVAFQNGAGTKLFSSILLPEPKSAFLAIDRAHLRSGEEALVEWSVPPEEFLDDWIGLFNAYEGDEDPIMWEYAYGPEGSIRILFPQAGFYEVRYFRYNGTRSKRIMETGEILVVDPPILEETPPDVASPPYFY